VRALDDNRDLQQQRDLKCRIMMAGSKDDGGQQCWEGMYIWGDWDVSNDAAKRLVLGGDAMWW
jgi:hypothetical protein